MKPLNFSDNDSNDEETLSFLPQTKGERIPKTIGINSKKNQRVRKKRNHYNDTAGDGGFCLPWMVKSIVFMLTFFGILVLKGYHEHLVIGSKGSNSSHSKNDDPDKAVVTEWKNLKLDGLKHWCLDEASTSCKCASPLTPIPRHGHKTWTEAYQQNLNFVETFQSDRNTGKSSQASLDVVFLGDSITEGWRGTSFNKTVENKQKNLKVYQSLFDKSKGADLDGLVLGIAGDKSPNLLWRIQNGELPPYLHSKVYWVLIGTNDFLKDGFEHCSAEVVFMGVQRILEEIKLLKPDAKIVVNEILPRAPSSQDGYFYKDEESRSVMNAINKVNEQLRALCQKSESLLCFDATEIFMKRNETLGEGIQNEYIPRELMHDFLHPSAKGYSQWGTKIAQTIKRIINENI